MFRRRDCTPAGVIVAVALMILVVASLLAR